MRSILLFSITLLVLATGLDAQTRGPQRRDAVARAEITRGATRATAAGHGRTVSDRFRPTGERAGEPLRPGIRIRLEEHATIRGTDVRLRDIAHVESADRELLAALDEITIARRPNFGFNRRLARAEVLRQLANAGLHAADIELGGASGVLLQPLTHVLRPEQVVEVAEPTLRSWLESRSEDAFELKVAQRLSPEHVPPGRFSFDLAPRVDTSRASVFGRAAVLVDVVVDGAVWKTLRVDFEVTRFYTALRLTRPIERGMPITPDAIEFYREVLRTGRSMQVRDLAAVQGKVAARRLAAGQTLQLTDLAEPAIVRQGDVVRVVATSGGIRVVIKAFAQEDAAEGQRVRVLTLTDRRLLHGVAVAPGIVTVTPN